MSAAVETSVDWALLEADMPAIPCEDIQHEDLDPDGGPATHMFRARCPKCDYMTDLIAVCAGLVSDVIGGRKLRCASCKHVTKAQSFIETLQPIKATR